MESIGEWVKKARSKVIASVYPSPIALGVNPDSFPNDFFNEESKPEDFVWVIVNTQTGFDATKASFVPVRKDSVAEFIKQNPPGTKLAEPSLPFEYDMKEPVTSLLMAVGDDNGWCGDCYEILRYVGIIDRTYSTTPEVLETWDVKKTEWAKKQFGDNWNVAIQSEFALQNYPRTSAVGYAARIFYCHFIKEDDYAVGYLWREFEVLMKQETELAAFEEEANRKKDGSKKGGKTTTDKYVALRADCLGYVATAYKLKGSSFLSYSIEAQAEVICEIALGERPDEFIGPNGNPLSLRWFTNALEDFRADGQLGKAIEEAVKMNKA